MSNQPPLKPGTVWTTCTLRVINEETNKFEKVGECPDTPNAIRAKMQELGLSHVWVFHSWGEKEYRSLLD